MNCQKRTGDLRGQSPRGNYWIVYDAHNETCENQATAIYWDACWENYTLYCEKHLPKHANLVAKTLDFYTD
jgi:hypothetical protein